MKKITSFIFFTAFLILGSIIFICVAFYNKFPLVFSDTGTYIRYAFELIVPYDRPIMYSLFIRYVSLGSSLWSVIFIQGIILTYLIFLCVKYLAGAARPLLTSIIVITLLSAFTGISIYCSQIMPDIFTGITILVFILLATVKNLSKTNTILLIILLIVSTCVHLSHMIINVIMLGTFVLYYFYNRKKNARDTAKRKLILISIVVIISIASIPTLNYFYQGGFKFSKTSHIFFMARMSENGILKKFLNENCNNESYSLCHYKDSLPNNTGTFLWNNTSPLYKTGGWDNSKDEYSRIITKTFTTPKYLYMQITEGVKAFLKQLFRIESGNIVPYLKDTPPYNLIQKNFNHELNEYLNSEQSYGTIGVGALKEFNNRQVLVIIFSWIFLLVIIMSLLNRKKDLLKNPISEPLVTLIVLVLTGIIANALVCGALSMPDARYQNRVIWLLPFLVIIILLKKDVRHLLIEQIRSLLKRE